MAWAEKLPSGRYRGGYRDSAKRKRYVLGDDGRGFTRKSDAKDAANELEVKGRRRATAKTRTLSARMKWGQWWDHIEPDRKFVSGTNYVEDNLVKNYIRPKWGDVPLNEITHGSVQRWVDVDLKVRPGMSPGYAQRIYAVLSVSLTQAVKEEVLDASPCVGITLPKRQKRQKPHLLPSHLDKLTKLRQDYRNAVEFVLETGIRPGEMAGLHADQLDLELGFLDLTNVYLWKGGTRLIRAHPKDKDTRVVPLTPRAMELVLANLDGRDVTAGCGVPHADGSACRSVLVFLTELGKPINTDAMGQAMDRATEKAGLPKLKMYAVRRGFATRAADGELDPIALKEIMGHASFDQTAEYIQRTQSARRKLLAALSKGDRGANEAGSGAGLAPARQDEAS